MPYTQLDGKLVFVKLEPFKPVYGAWKGSEGKEFIYIRKIEYSSLLAGDWEKFKKNFTENKDWYIPVKFQENFDWSHKTLAVKPNESDCLWLSWILTPANQLYLVKTRLSISGVMSYGATAMTLMNPAVAAGWLGPAGWLFIQKQGLKRSLSKQRQEQSPSFMPKVLARKCWFVDLEKYEPYEYANHLLVRNLL